MRQQVSCMTDLCTQVQIWWLKPIEGIRNKSIQPLPQDHSMAKNVACKIFKNNSRINWDDDVEHVYNTVRGLSPYPCAWTVLKVENAEIEVKIFKAKCYKQDHNRPFGSIFLDKKTLKIASKGGFFRSFRGSNHGP